MAKNKEKLFIFDMVVEILVDIAAFFLKSFSWLKCLAVHFRMNICGF